MNTNLLCLCVEYKYVSVCLYVCVYVYVLELKCVNMCVSLCVHLSYDQINNTSHVYDTLLDYNMKKIKHNVIESSESGKDMHSVEIYIEKMDFKNNTLSY